jgi:hypothetical protein
MKVRVQVVIEADASKLGDVQDILEITREELHPETVGLTLDEAKTVLERLQQRIVEQQAATYLHTQSYCPHCGAKRYHKGQHTVTLRTLFGKLRLKSLRVYHCPCRPHPTRTFSPLAERLPERSKWYLWHGNVYEARISIDNLELLLDNDEDLTPKRRSLLKALRDFRVYITTNARLIPNYGERRRYGEAIATGFVESTVNQVVSKRFVKQQQMKWSPRGAHLLLQMRTRVLNGELRQTFQQWYPGMQNDEGELREAA